MMIVFMKFMNAFVMLASAQTATELRTRSPPLATASDPPICIALCAIDVKIAESQSDEAVTLLMILSSACLHQRDSRRCFLVVAAAALALFVALPVPQPAGGSFCPAPMGSGEKQGLLRRSGKN
jgi:hypothetical protein